MINNCDIDCLKDSLAFDDLLDIEKAENEGLAIPRMEVREDEKEY